MAMKKITLNPIGFLLLILLVLNFAFLSCSKDKEFKEEPPVEEEEEEPNTFKGPTYPDDYTDIASWGLRSQWNLANVHDPTVTKAGDYFYMYQTDASYGNVHVGHGHFPVRRSKDLVHWDFMGMAFSEVPTWVKDSLNNIRSRMNPPLPPIENPNYGFWAPYIQKVGGKYRLYYSIVVTNPIIGTDPNTSWTARAFIGLAESDNLASNVWEDKGMVVSSIPDGKETYKRDGPNDWSGYFKFNAIDPSVVITPEGEHWLAYGSWHSGIAAVELDPGTGKPFQLENIDDYGTRIAGRGNVDSNRWQGLEAPEIIYNEETGYYYLFLAYDELSVAYNTRVVRSKNVTGPFVGINGANVTEGAEAWPMLTHPYAFNGHTGWVGISHASIFQDPETGEWFYASQGRLPVGVPGINVSNALMMGQIRRVYWLENGWPVVSPERYAAVPETTITEESIVGTWEQIILEYEYQTIQRSSQVIFKADHTIDGPISGSWSFDAKTNTLTINGRKYIVDDAWDWETSPRKTTLIYSGLTTTGRSVWGKKIN